MRGSFDVSCSIGGRCIPDDLEERNLTEDAGRQHDLQHSKGTGTGGWHRTIIFILFRKLSEQRRRHSMIRSRGRNGGVVTVASFFGPSVAACLRRSLRK